MRSKPINISPVFSVSEQEARNAFKIDCPHTSVTAKLS